MKDFKIRASAVGKIMTESKIRMTEKQLITLSELQAKPSRTEKQQQLLDDLIYKRDNPTLSEGAKTYCKQWVTEQLFDRQKEFTSKYCDKGNEVEVESMNFASDILKLGMVFKNEQFFENEYCCGTPDLLPGDLVIDMKNSWDCFSFPLFETEPDINYFYQLQAYMWLTNNQKSLLVYCLMDTPEMLIQDEIRRYGWKNGMIEVPMELEEEIRIRMTYANIPPEKRIKTFEIGFDQNVINAIIGKVILCRAYILELLEFLN